ncbi:MAG: PQQ-like beta-propeller repeat protein [Verrucomicrobiales bacterium]|nr:PQQ-like beta-propeller repeat protein [Verrucomicrobiales bacterium]
MMSNYFRQLSVAAILLTGGSMLPVGAQNEVLKTDWRGPKRDGMAPDKGLLKDWEKAPRLVWSLKGLGKGLSAVNIADGKMFTMGQRKGGEFLLALDWKTQKELWAAKVSGKGDTPNCTPVYSSGLVYALGFGGDLVCVDAKTGKEVWRKDFAKDFTGRMMSGWGYSESPLVDGNRVIVTPGGDHALMAALDCRTGKVIWQTDTTNHGSGGAAYSSPVISHGGGTKQYLTLTGKALVSVDAASGKLLWAYERIANGTANIPTPLVLGDHIFTSTGYGTGAALLKLSKDGSGVKAEEVYFLEADKFQNHHGGMVAVGDCIYAGTGHNNGFPICIEWKSGRIIWGKERHSAGKESAAVLFADGKLYFRYQNGIMALIDATPKGYVEKGHFKIATADGPSWPHPVIFDKKLVLRDQDSLHCYDLAAD